MAKSTTLSKRATIIQYKTFCLKERGIVTQVGSLTFVKLLEWEPWEAIVQEKLPLTLTTVVFTRYLQASWRLEDSSKAKCGLISLRLKLLQIISTES